ncbi:hypothetical protein EG339_02715 [Chryseobacterium bernardetii]|uniref:Uncharacterized protein n=1 Tax=Chryseobacterium bernardetii TaxID=1241978 RepID=A0A3G6T6W1_9FLAO|nr:hypothetical protein [Chryseobacterium bernardetii]AZB23609.1 hypothetical protein EG339_02715 [Chryseobacterium bernardetii]
MKELEELTREIREKLPRLKEVKKQSYIGGCNIMTLSAPMLNDVLEWHSKYYCKNSHFEVLNIVINDEKHPAGVFIDYSEEYTARFIWDLSKPFLKDQSPELIKFLHSLIKTKQ